ncbi:thioesterase thiol ester dehydrase-isomerase [Flagelloscypha sp. PMI_526]|nr:thioesterase thiol ester dehydrase-isomerase [Flagelloscypha sp. PMI_526]
MAEYKKRTRNDYNFFVPIVTRWSDNDQYSHVNNAIYYHFFDSCVNTYLIQKCSLVPSDSNSIGLVVSSHCQYFKPLSFPETLEVGLKVTKLGTSSATYEMGIFQSGSESPAAVGGYTHVFVDHHTRKSLPMPTSIKSGLSLLSKPIPKNKL